MLKWTVFGDVLAFAALSVWSTSSLAAGKARVHLGLETAIVTSRSTETTQTDITSACAAPVSTKYVSSSTQYGLPGAQALSLGVVISDVVDLGARFGYSNTTTKTGSDATSPEVTLDEYALSPYVAYISGNRESRVRFTAGGLLGIAAGNTSYQATPSSATTPASTIKSSVSSTHYGVLFGARLHASDLLSIDPIATVTSTSTTISATGRQNDLELSGMTFMLNVGFSLWFGGEPREAPPQRTSPQDLDFAQPKTTAPTSSSPTLPVPTPAVAGLPPAQSQLASASAPTANAPAANASIPASTPPVAPAPAVTTETTRSTRLSLSLGETRSALLVVNKVGQTQTVSIVLRESRPDSNLSTCKHLVLNAPYQPEISLPATLARGITANGTVPVLKAEAALEQLQSLAASPATDVDGASDHWIDVCGRPWHLGETDREQLKTFLDAAALVP